MFITAQRLQSRARFRLRIEGVFCGAFLLVLTLGWSRGGLDQTEAGVLASAAAEYSGPGATSDHDTEVGVARAEVGAAPPIDAELHQAAQITSDQPFYPLQSSPFDGDVALHASVPWYARSWHALEIADHIQLPIGVTGSMDSAESFRVTEVQDRSGGRRRVIIESMRNDLAGAMSAEAPAEPQRQCRGLLTFSAHQAYGTLSCPEQSWVLEARDGTLSVASEYWLRLRQAPDADDQHFPPAASI